MQLRHLAVLAILLAPGPGQSQEWPVEPLVSPIPVARPASLTFDAARICTLISDAAGSHGLPEDFFARLIWKESRFDIRALSPVGAQGVAQFMPATAKARGLKDPWDPRQAIPASASFLADLKTAFGNWGLAAAGYNGGPHRVERWLAGTRRSLPYETQDYVLSITGRPVEWFRKQGREVEPRPLEKGKPFDESCARLPVMATRATPVAGAPWGVQVAAGISRRAAARAFSRARARLSSVIGGRSPIIVRSRKVSGRRLYSARVGAASRGEARQLCSRIRRAGGSCVVRRN